MGIFGWSYPPGCSGPPDYEDEPCAICGNMPDNCTCPECKVLVDCGDGINKIECGQYACLEHMNNNELAAHIRLKDFQLLTLQNEAKRREITLPPCPKCGTIHKISILQDYEPYCCGFQFWRGEWHNYDAEL